MCEAGSAATRMRFVGTSGSWRLCCGERLNRGRLTSLYAVFYSQMQSVGETLAEYSRALNRLHQRIEGAASTMAERQALAVLGDGTLKHQYVVGVWDEWVRHELRWLMLRFADRPFIVVRGEALCLTCDNEARVLQMRPVEKAAPASSGPVGGSVSYVLGLDAIVLGNGGVSSGAVSGGLCDLDSVSRGDVVGGVDEMSVPGGGDAVVSGVDKSLCGVNSLCQLVSSSCGCVVLTQWCVVSTSLCVVSTHYVSWCPRPVAVWC